MAVEAHKRNIRVTGFLPECVWCPVMWAASQLLYVCKINTWLVFCTCAILSDSCVCVCVYCHYVLKCFMLTTFDNCVKWYWPTPGWGNFHCVVFRQMYCFTGQENQYYLCLTLGAELQYTSLHELQLHVWVEIKWYYFQLASVLFRFELQQVIWAIVYM